MREKREECGKDGVGMLRERERERERESRERGESLTTLVKQFEV